jgi:hypothetical protein
VDWIIKDWLAQCHIPIAKPTMRKCTLQSSKPKEMIEEGSLARTRSSTDNTRTTTSQTLPTGSSLVPKQPRRTPISTRIGSWPPTKKKDIAQVVRERVQGTTSEEQPSQTTGNPAQGKYAHKKRKYETEDPYITLTWDDTKLVADKVQDRSEEVVRTGEAQRELIMAKLIEVHQNIQHIQGRVESHATAQQQEKE